MSGWAKSRDGFWMDGKGKWEVGKGKWGEVKSERGKRRVWMCGCMDVGRWGF